MAWPATPPPPPPGYSAPNWGLSWPGPGRVAPPLALGAALVTAIVAAILLSWTNFGIGWFVTAVVGAGAATLAGWAIRRQNAAEPSSQTGQTGQTGQIGQAGQADQAQGPRWPATTFWSVLAVALIGVGTFRSAAWLWALCLPTAVICGTLAVTGVRTLRGMFLGFFTFPAAVLRALPWTVRGLNNARGRSGSSFLRVAVSVVIGLILLLIFGALLANADAAFGKIIDNILPTINAGTVFGAGFSFVLLGFGTLGAAFLAGAQPSLDGGLGKGGRLRPIEWGIPVGALVLLFGGFVAVQATYMFGGRDVVLRTADLTAAEYARQGFWQLVVVTVLTLIVTGVAGRLASRETAGQRVAIRVLLGLLAALTLTIVGSALSRMWAYEQAFGATRLRLLVAVFELWLGLVFVLILLAGIRLDRRSTWVPAAAAGAAALTLLGLAVLNPDRFIAERNIDRYDATGKVDLYYLAELSPDAVPALVELDGSLRSCALRGAWATFTGTGYYSDYDGELAEPDPWREWNLARAQARDLLVGFKPLDYETCDRLAKQLDPTSDR